MHLAFYRPSSNQHRTPQWRRGTALVLALAVHFLIIMMLLMQAPPPPRPPEEEAGPVTFQLLPQASAEPAKARTEEKTKRSSKKAPPKPATPPVTPPTVLPPPPVEMMILSKEEFAAADISKLPSPSEASETASAGSGKDSSAVYGPGQGPGGERLYEAEWYRRPTQAQLSSYIPADAPKTGWGLVACRTIENYQVDNCQTLGESPLGSGLARAVRLAAWQFRVLPPRVGGRPIIGAWVRIRIDYSQGVARQR